MAKLVEINVHRTVSTNRRFLEGSVPALTTAKLAIGDRLH